jgi:hypothetical protein
VFGAANLGAAFMPLLTGVLVGVLGFPAVFLGAAAVALLALPTGRTLAAGSGSARLDFRASRSGTSLLNA